MNGFSAGNQVAMDWQRRLFDVACDAEECARWFESFSIFEHLVSLGATDIEIRLRLGRAALHVDRFDVALEQSLEIDRLLHECPDLRRVFANEAAGLRNNLQRHDFEQYEIDSRNLSSH